MKKLFLLLIFICSSLHANTSIVCIHGFMGGKWSMHFLAKNLKGKGYDVVNWNYPSRSNTINNHSKKLVLELNKISNENPNEPIYFVAHSMGSLVLLAALNDVDCPQEAKVGRVVLIAPPLKGSLWARWLHQFSFVNKFVKEFSGAELMTKENFSDLGEYPNSLEKILVIAGDFGFNPILHGKNDGTIMVEETYLSSPHERFIIKRGHKSIVFSKKVASVTKSFLQNP